MILSPFSNCTLKLSTIILDKIGHMFYKHIALAASTGIEIYRPTWPYSLKVRLSRLCGSAGVGTQLREARGDSDILSVACLSNVLHVECTTRL